MFKHLTNKQRNFLIKTKYDWYFMNIADVINIIRKEYLDFKYGM